MNGTPPTAPHGAHRRGRARWRGDRGVTAVEFAGWVPLLLLVAFAALQLGITGFAAIQAGSAARTAARLASREETEDEYREGGYASLGGMFAERAEIDLTAACGEEATVTVRVPVPSVLPFFLDSVGTATRSVTMPCD
ncbi:TadE/TadG family type IV pilus assembly protein [Streptomyces sp. RFCAC02]|uniref:TadE/TadG family type IV pilus assembly protein n=1 Tax=Streptomyces sp. RFCAC02 TaxID=2499143 RepID=UPI001021907E|nr:TadE/TadG family type IV pilus assembly protein [Streptomyces sp. RFCAC02]